MEMTWLFSNYSNEFPRDSTTGYEPDDKAQGGREWEWCLFKSQYEHILHLFRFSLKASFLGHQAHKAHHTHTVNTVYGPNNSMLSTKMLWMCTFKGIVQPKMKIKLWSTNPQAILGVYDFLLSDEYNQSSIKKCPGSSKLYNGSEWGLRFWSPKKCVHPS